MRNEILLGNVLDRLPEIPEASVQCCVTSPPYYDLRDYGSKDQIGLEDSPDEYVESLVQVFRLVWRALRNDGVLWLNLGDSYAAKKSCWGLKPKDLYGMPWRVAFALQADGWYLRSDVVWAKSNCMPESVVDRPTKSHEYVFLLTKGTNYFYDQESIREPWADERNGASGASQSKFKEAGSGRSEGDKGITNPPQTTGRNKRSVWTVNPKPYKQAHFAVMPEELARICIKAGSSEKGCCTACRAPWRRVFQAQATGFSNTPTAAASLRLPSGWEPSCACDAQLQPCLVLDPFSGAGTTAVSAVRLGRDFLGVELNPSYLDLSLKRLAPVIEERAQQSAVQDLWDEDDR